MYRTLATLAAGAAAAVAAATAAAQLGPPPGMVRTVERTVSCARTLPKVSFSISSHNGPMGIDAMDDKQYAFIGLRNAQATIRTAGCRVLPRRPALASARLGRRWNLREEYFEVKQFSCAYRGPLVLHVRAERRRGRVVANHFAAWTTGGRRLLALGQLRSDGRGWLRVARSCSLSYSR